VFAGVLFGCTFVKSDDPVPFLDSLARYDGLNYKRIADEGYEYSPQRASLVAFFPAYPLISKCLARLSGWGTLQAMVVVSNICCLMAFVLLAEYLRAREQSSENSVLLASSQTNGESRAGDGYALAAMGAVPATFFFRMAYTESMFLCLAVLACYAMLRRWPVAVIALIVGTATAIRSVSVALLFPLVWHIWTTSASRRHAVRRSAYIMPLACWGLLGFMLYQWQRFGTPLAFAINQKYHRARDFGTISDQVLSLLSWAPIRDAYDPTSPGYWQALYSSPNRLFSLEFANPIYFVAGVALIIIGAWKRWLTSCEIILAVPMLAISYFTRAYEMRMFSQSRFTTVVFPVYIVLGNILVRLPPPVACSLLVFSGFLLGAYAALFAAGYPFF
jgi:hypothetical protein